MRDTGIMSPRPAAILPGRKKPPCRRRARRGCGAGQAWVIGSGRCWHAAAEKVITWDWERNARSEGGERPR